MTDVTDAAKAKALQENRRIGCGCLGLLAIAIGVGIYATHYQGPSTDSATTTVASYPPIDRSITAGKISAKLHGSWVDSDGYTMEFSGTTLREHGNIGGSSLDLTSNITYKEPNEFDKPGLAGTVYPWRVIFDDPDHIEVIPPDAGLAPVEHFRRQ